MVSLKSNFQKSEKSKNFQGNMMIMMKYSPRRLKLTKNQFPN